MWGIITQIIFWTALVGLPVAYGLAFKNYKHKVGFHVSVWACWLGLGAMGWIWLYADFLK